MPVLRVILDVDTSPDPAIGEKRAAGLLVHLPDPDMAFIRVPRGMQSGADSVMVRIELPDGRIVLAETSMALFQLAARAFAAKGQS